MNNDPIKHQRKFLNLALRSERLLTVDDITDILSNSLFSTAVVYCFCISDEGTPLPSLCLRWDGTTSHPYYNPDAVQQDVTNLRALLKEGKNSGVYRSCSGLYTVYYIGPAGDQYKRAVRLLAKICDITQRGSLNRRNLGFARMSEELSLFCSELRAGRLESHSSLCSFIRAHWKVHAHILEVPPKKLRSREDTNWEGLTANNPTLSRIARVAVKEKRNRRFILEAQRTGRPITGRTYTRRNAIYFLLVPMTTKIVQHPVHIRRFLLAWSLSPLTLSIALSVIECVDHYVRERYVSRRTTAIINLQNAVIDAALSAPSLTHSLLREKLTAISQRALKAIISTTHAHSAVVRLYHASDQTLQLLCEEYHFWASHDQEKAVYAIPLSKYKTSVNAFTFLLARKPKPFTYIPDFRKQPAVPDEYRARGLRTVLHLRRASMSEICFCLYSGDVPFGVINVESDLPNAFDHDIEYLRALKSAVERYYDALTRARDTLWLADASAIFQRSHEGLNVLATSQFTEAQRAILQPFLMPPEIQDSGSLVNIAGLERDIHSWIEGFETPSLIGPASTILRCKCHADTWITASRYTKIIYIIQNLLVNSLIYGDCERDRLTIVRQPHYAKDAAPYLVILLESYGVFTPEVMERLTLAPIKRGDRHHYGTFLIGVWARSMGGLVHVCQSGPFSTIEVRVPLREGEQ